MVETGTEASSDIVLWRQIPEGGDSLAEFIPTPENQAHVYSIPLDPSVEQLERFSETLSVAELTRAERFHFEVHRCRYIAARGALRQILCSYLGVAPQVVEFICGAHGKPALAGRFGNTGLEFNLAHSDNLALVAVTRRTQVGIDLELVRFLPEFDELVARFFSRREAQLFERLTPALKAVAFFNLWTRKEALLKATGEGIAHCLSQVEVNFLPGEAARLLRVPSHFGEVADWRLRELRVEPRFVAALAVGKEQLAN